MLSPDLELRDLDARHWANWWRLLVPPRVLDRPVWQLVILDGGTPIRTIGPAGGAVIRIEQTLIAELSAEIEPQLALDQDFLQQGLIVLRALKRHAGKGIATDPAILDVLPTPNYDGIQRTFDLLVPDRSALLAYVIEDDRSRVHASIIATKQAGDITRAATHRAIVELVPEATLARTWDKGGHERVLDAIGERFERPSIGVFLERATLKRIMTGPSDQLARELNAKKVVIDPAPAWLLGLLGGAAMAAMAGRAAKGLAALLPQKTRDRASAFATRAGTAIKESGPFAQLGFDPLELWSRVRHFYRE